MSDVLILASVNMKDDTDQFGRTWPYLGPMGQPREHVDKPYRGLLWGTGRWDSINLFPNAVWKVVQADERFVTDCITHAIFTGGEVVYSGSRRGATDYIGSHGGETKGCHWITLSGGKNAVLVGGDYSHIEGGEWSTLSGGIGSVFIAGAESVIAGNYIHGDRVRRKIALVGSSSGYNLAAGVPYTLDNKGKCVEAQGVARNV